MDEIIWDDKFSVGVAKLDKQHIKLIKIINKLINITDISASSGTLTDVLTEITEYANYHFETEEKYMRDIGFVDYSSHKNQHMKFKKQTADFCFEAIQNKDNIPSEILAYLKDWLTNHILKSDMQYKIFLDEQGKK